MAKGQPYFGLKGGWLTFWVTVACATDMTVSHVYQTTQASLADTVISSLATTRASSAVSSSPTTS